ncbi:MAG TPA: ABC transporter permease [Thermoanaerobaculia bacterium]|nr:ABC transporter permease [Thermoanaerobaculia bacterium]
MIRHLLKLVWRRKRANALVMTEIFFSFLVVFAVVTMAVSMIRRWNAPLGYEWRNVWVVKVENVLSHDLAGTHRSTRATSGIDPKLLTDAQLIDRVTRELRGIPQIAAAGSDSMPAYGNAEWTSVLGEKNRRTDVTADFASDDFARVMNLKVLRGRWFRPEDDAADYLAIVVDADAAKGLFGSVDKAIGQKLPGEGFRADPNSPKELRVVGVIAPYRKSGELSGPQTRMVFFRSSVTKPQTPEPKTIVLAVRPGTPASFEAELSNRLHAMAPDVTFRVQRMEQMRRLNLRVRFTPLAALAVVALFLISMVTLGLTGVLWQTVTRRMREIGLRRALGASGAGVRRQVMGEVTLLATLAVILGVVIVLQLPLLGLMRLVTAGEFSAGFATALAVIYGITLLCGAYPSWLASRIEPAEALRYE